MVRSRHINASRGLVIRTGILQFRARFALTRTSRLCQHGEAAVPSIGTAVACDDPTAPWSARAHGHRFAVDVGRADAPPQAPAGDVPAGERSLPGGTNSNFRAWGDDTVYIDRGKGGRIWDLDQNEYIDLGWATAR
jgi:hypothetical protein